MRNFLHIGTDKKISGVKPTGVSGPWFRRTYFYDLTAPGLLKKALQQLGTSPVKYIVGGRI